MRNSGLLAKIVVPVGIIFIVILTALHGGSVWLGVFQVDIISQLLVFPNFLYPLSVILGFTFVISVAILIFMRIKRQDSELPQKLVAVFGVAFVVSSAIFIGVFWWSAYQHQQCGQGSTIKVVKKESWSEIDCKNLSGSQLNQYPAIKGAIELKGYRTAVNVSLKEMSRLREVGDCVKVDGKYFGIDLYDVVVAKEVENTSVKSVGELAFLEQELARIGHGSYARTPTMMESLSQTYKSRMKEEGKLVVAPDGFLLTNVTREELVKAKEFEGVIEYNGSYYQVYVAVNCFWTRVLLPTHPAWRWMKKN